MDDHLVWVPVDALWNWFDVGAYLKELQRAQFELVRRVLRESAWFPHAVGEEHSVGLFQQSAEW